MSNALVLWNANSLQYGRTKFLSPCTAGKTARMLVPLFSGGTFDAGFNGADNRRPITVSTPAGTARAYIEAVITGKLVSDKHSNSWNQKPTCADA